MERMRFTNALRTVNELSKSHSDDIIVEHQELIQLLNYKSEIPRKKRTWEKEQLFEGHSGAVCCSVIYPEGQNCSRDQQLTIFLCFNEMLSALIRVKQAC